MLEGIELNQANIPLNYFGEMPISIMNNSDELTIKGVII